jgi:hypothetical protein
MIRFGMENVKRNENNESESACTLLVLCVNLRMVMRVCLKNLNMQYKNSGEKSYARRWSTVKPPDSFDSTRPDLSVWETVKKTPYIQGPKTFCRKVYTLRQTLSRLWPKSHQR